MTNTSDDMLAAAKDSTVTAKGEFVHEADRHHERKRKLSWESTNRGRASRRSRASLSLVIGGGLVLAAIWFIQRGGGEESGSSGVEATASTAAAATHAGSPAGGQTADSTITATQPSRTTQSSTTSALTGTCRGGPCAVLQVKGTLETPGGEGVWIRRCADDSPCERRALAAEGQQIYAVCRVDTGKDVFGDTVWVKTPWVFSNGSIPQDKPVRAEATGHSDPNSQQYGYAAAYFLTPRAAIDALPLCTT